MKKKILSFVLIISILSSLFTAFQIAASAAGTEMPVTIKSVYCYYVDNKVGAEVEFSSVKEAGIMYLAVYNQGKLVTVGQDTISTEKLKKTIEIPDIYENCIGYDAKIICFGGESSLTPISIHAKTQVVEYEAKIVRVLREVTKNITPCIDRYAENSVYSQFTGQERTMLKKIKTCIDDALANYKDELTAELIKEKYETQIKEVRDIYDEMQDEGKDDAFIGKLPEHFTPSDLIWLAETLGIDVAKFGIDKSKYL